MSRYTIYLALILSLSFIVLSNGIVLASNHSASQIEAQQAIDTAQTAIFEAFGQITQADLAGADITDLVLTLNMAINNLNLARAAYNVSEYASAILLAESARDAAEVVSNEAQSRLVIAHTNSTIQILLIVTVVVAAVVITYLLITRWQKHKQQRTRTLLRMKISLPKEEESDK